MVEYENSVTFFMEIRHISPPVLAKNLDISVQTLQAIENGRYNLSVSLALKIAKELNTDLDHLFFMKN